MEAARQRCTNTNDPAYPRYGQRGIKFQFATVAEAAVWVLQNLGAEKDQEIDRTDNDGDYAPGNLQWSTRRQNLANQTRSHADVFHKVRASHPEVRYADNTLRRLSGTLTVEEICERWAKPSCKPKGVYGTYSTADPGIVSRLTGD
jgi:hypothetical protein